MSTLYHRSNTLRNRLAAGFSVIRLPENDGENDSTRDRFPGIPNATCRTTRAGFPAKVGLCSA